MRTPRPAPGLALCAAAALAAACTTPAAPPPPVAPPSASLNVGRDSAFAGPSTAEPPATAAPPPASPTGLLSEEDFKALHQLTAEKAPPARGQPVEIDGTRAYLSLPPGAKPPLPGVVVIHEWWGLNDHIRHWADRLAEDGYASLAVDLYGGKVATNPDEAMAAMKSVNDEAARKTLLAAHRFLTTDARVSAPRTASIGWCFGGKWSLQLALAEPELDAAVIYYGHLVTDVEKLKAIRAPVLGIFGNQDKSITPADVDAFDKGLHDAGVVHEIHRYDANHAFANPSGARYDEKSAADAWEHVRRFLAAKLKQT